MNRSLRYIHIILIVLELIALAHDFYAFGGGLFQYYTIDSNVLQMFVSAGILLCLRRGEEKDACVPLYLQVLHLVCAVALTVTFLIAALVLAPQEGFAYYFLSDVAPINHFLAPLLSVLTFLFSGKSGTLPRKAVLAPAAASLLYGDVLLVLNALRLTDGPYFFLRIHDEAPMTVFLWFVIIAALCLMLAAAYMWLRGRLTRRRA